MEGQGHPRRPGPPSDAESWPIWRIGYLTLTLAVDWQPAAPPLQPPSTEDQEERRGGGGGEGARGVGRLVGRPSPYPPPRGPAAELRPQPPQHPPPGWPARLHAAPRSATLNAAVGGQLHLGVIAEAVGSSGAPATPLGVPQTPVDPGPQTPRTPGQQMPEWLRIAAERERLSAAEGGPASSSGGQEQGQAADSSAEEVPGEPDEPQQEVSRRRRGRPSRK